MKTTSSRYCKITMSKKGSNSAHYVLAFTSTDTKYDGYGK